MKNRMYFDYAASTPMRKEVLRAMRPYFDERFGNASSLHHEGQAASAALDASRESVAKLLGGSFRDIVFTSSATTANNLFIQGASIAFRKKFPSVQPKIIISAFEHESIRAATEALAGWGVEIVVIPPTKTGSFDFDIFAGALDHHTAIVSVIHTSNETGVLLPAKEIGECIRAFREKNSSAYPLFHIDAAQAFGYYDCAPAQFAADAVTLSAHKVYGPKGVGVLYCAPRLQKENLIAPITFGGGQEFGLWPGTENIPSIVGAATAFTYAARERKKMKEKVHAMRTIFEAELLRALPHARVWGSHLPRAPHISSIFFPGVENDELLARLDQMGAQVSLGPACASHARETSTVLRALGCSDEDGRQTIRVSFGELTREKEVHRLVGLLAHVGNKNH